MISYYIIYKKDTKEMNDILIDNKYIYNFELNFITYFSFLMKIFFVLFMVGAINNNLQSLMIMNFFIKLLLGCFLVYRFNKYRSKKIILSELDRKIIHSSGLYIIILSFSDIIIAFLDSIRKLILPYTSPMIEKIKKLVI